MNSPPQPPGTVGFVGLGAMGLPMAANLAKAGFDVLVWARGRIPLDAAVAAGCRAAGRPADVAAGARTVITMLPDLPQVRDVSAGPDGLLAGLDTAAPAEAMDTLVVMGTVSPVAVRALAQELRSIGVTVVDAPVSGGVTGARDATLSIMAGGTEYAVESVRPYLTAMGSTVRRMGDTGAGSLAKACNQLVVAGTLVALSEAVVLGEHGGLDPAALLEVLAGGLASSEVLAQKRRHLADSDFTPRAPPATSTRTSASCWTVPRTRTSSCRCPPPSPACTRRSTTEASATWTTASSSGCCVRTTVPHARTTPRRTEQCR